MPLALAFREAGFDVAGVDLDAAKIDQLRNGESYITDVSDEEVANAGFEVSTDYATLADADMVALCVRRRFARRAIQICRTSFMRRSHSPR